MQKAPFKSGEARGSGKPVTRQFSLTRFTGISASDTFDVTITIGATFAVSVTADDNLFDYLIVDVRDGNLHLGVDSKGGTVQTSTKLKASVTLPELRSLALSGASRAKINGRVAVPELAVSSTGASEFTATTISVREMHLELTGASRATVSGSVGAAKLRFSGASVASLDKLETERAEIELSGASTAAVRVSAALSYRVSGASRLTYSGSPKIGTSENSGASSVSRRL